MSYILNILICVGMILLDNLLQCFMFIVVIDLSCTFDSTIVSIYNLFFMFIIYFQIKIKLKVLIFSTIQKPYFRHFSFMTGFVGALRSGPFTGVHFKRCQTRVTLWLTAMGDRHHVRVESLVDIVVVVGVPEHDPPEQPQ
jgi:hypothetical protein